jgi:hypothetical protein
VTLVDATPLFVCTSCGDVVPSYAVNRTNVPSVTGLPFTSVITTVSVECSCPLQWMTSGFAVN